MYYAMINGFCVATGDNVKSLSSVVKVYPGIITIIDSQYNVLKTIKSRAKPIVEVNDIPSLRLLSCLETYQ